MTLNDILDNKFTIVIVSAIIGSLITKIVQYIANKRGVFSFNVQHNRVGISSEDSIYGSIKVTWNETPVNHLYLSVVEVKNESIRDYNDVIVRIFTDDTDLLTEGTSIVGTTRIIEYTPEYNLKINVPAGKEPSQDQFSLFKKQRDYIVPTMNRGQLLRFEFLNAATSEDSPSIWVDILHKGVTCKFRNPARLIFGVSQSRAVLVGTIICLIGVILMVIFINDLIIASFISFLLGWITVIPGALAIKGFRKIRQAVTG